MFTGKICDLLKNVSGNKMERCLERHEMGQNSKMLANVASREGAHE